MNIPASKLRELWELLDDVCRAADDSSDLSGSVTRTAYRLRSELHDLHLRAAREEVDRVA